MLAVVLELRRWRLGHLGVGAVGFEASGMALQATCEIYSDPVCRSKFPVA